MWTVIMKLPHTKVKFYPEVKSQTSLIFTSGLMLTLAKISFANSCTGKWAIPEKKLNGLRIYLFKKFAGIFHFFTLPLEIPDKTAQPLDIPQNCVRSLGNSKTKRKDTLEIPHYFFLVTLGNTTSFLINARKFHMLFLWYPWNRGAVCFFFWNSPLHTENFLQELFMPESIWTQFKVLSLKLVLLANGQSKVT